jgi:hypothetical protein
VLLDSKAVGVEVSTSQVEVQVQVAKELTQLLEQMVVQVCQAQF